VVNSNTFKSLTYTLILFQEHVGSSHILFSLITLLKTHNKHNVVIRASIRKVAHVYKSTTKTRVLFVKEVYVDTF